MYDFSEYVDCEVADNGLFHPYPGLEDYWENTNTRFPYLIIKDAKYIGFVLVKFVESAESAHYSIAEFFVMKKYRREGIGRSAANQVFDLHKGAWQVYQRENNTPARQFWNRVISDYTKQHFTERLEEGRLIQEFTN